MPPPSRRTISGIAALAMAAAALPGAAQPISKAVSYDIRTYVCRRAPAPPVIDGDPTDACWRQAEVASDFVLLATEEPAALQTTARLLYDERNLYVSAICVEPNVDQIAAQPQGRDGAVWLDDSVELFLDTGHDHETYFQFIVSAAGSLLDSLNRDARWTAWGARSAARKGVGSWSMEMLIPLAVLGAATPAEGQAWGLNVWRNNYASAEGQSQWSCVAPDSGHAPLRSGDLIFGQPRYALDSVIFGDVYQGSSMIKAHVQAYVADAQDVSVRLDVISDSGATSASTQDMRLGDDAAGWLSANCDVPDMGPGHVTIEVGAAGGGGPVYRASYPVVPLGWRVRGLGLLSMEPSQECYGGSTPVGATVERVSGPEYAVTLPEVSVEMAVCDEAGERVTEALVARLTAADAARLRISHEWDMPEVPDGRYTVSVSVKGADGKVLGATSRPITMLQSLYAALGFGQAEADLAAALPRAQQAPESAFAACVATAEFHLDRARDQFAALSLRDSEDENMLWGLRLGAFEARRWTGPLAEGRLPFADATGRMLRASRSRVDGTLQLYSVFVPSTYDSAQASPLVLVLHPFDPDYGPFWEDWIGFYEYWAELRGYLLLCPFARGNQDFRGIGEADLWQAYDEMHRLYNIDERRVYVTGISMGGTGTWHVAARYPDQFAGLAAVAARGGNIRQLGPNLSAVPAYVVHGGADDIVPPQHSQAMAGATRRAGGRAFLSWHPLGGHLLFPEETRNVFDWFERCTRPAAPRQIRYRTETLKYDRAHWVRLDALGGRRRTPEIQATLSEDDAISVRVVNIDAYTLTPPPELVAPGADVTVHTNGRLSYEGPLPEEGLSLRRVPDSRDEFGRLPDDADADGGLRKRHGLQGPICEAFASPFLYVYGTGQADPALAAASEAAARAARDRMEKAAHGSFPLKADVDVTPEDIAEHNLILYGTPPVNGIMEQMADDLPMRLDNGRLALRGETLAAPSVGVKMIYPNPLAADKYVVVNLGTDADVLRALAQLRLYFVDYIVMGRHYGQQSYQCLRDGHFDQRWQLPTVPGGDVRVVTDTSWRCHDNPPAGWTAPGFDDTGWPQAAAHTKGLWPDINFATHFDDRAVAIWYPEPDPANVTRYFRRGFELAGPVQWARATVLVEDECELYVNGLRVRRIGYEEGVTTVSLRRHLQPGTNVIAVKAYEAFGDQCVVMDCAVKLREEHSPA